MQLNQPTKWPCFFLSRRVRHRGREGTRSVPPSPAQTIEKSDDAKVSCPARRGGVAAGAGDRHADQNSGTPACWKMLLAPSLAEAGLYPFYLGLLTLPVE